jgi:lipopolysaccharide export system permease protein
MVLLSLTGVIWVTQALRGIDLMTSQGQTIVTFLGFTSLVIPSLVLVIAPIALMIAVAYTLNKLGNDSEVIVMNAAGLSPLRLFRPFLVTALVTSLLVAVVAAYLAPDGLRRARKWNSDITADVLTNVLQPGRFAQLEANLIIRVRERQPGGLLAGIFVDDRRNPAERVTILGERGNVVKTESGSMLVLEEGTLQRVDVAGKKDPAIVAFTRYAFDMSRFSRTGSDVSLSTRDRYLWELMWPSPSDPAFQQNPGQFTSELHDRLMAPIYPFAFVAITFAFLGTPRTTRQSRNFSIGTSIAASFALRAAGFACSVIAARNFAAVPLQYAMLAATIALSSWLIATSKAVEPPAWLIESLGRLTARLGALRARPAHSS